MDMPLNNRVEKGVLDVSTANLRFGIFFAGTIGALGVQTKMNGDFHSNHFKIC